MGVMQVGQVGKEGMEQSSIPPLSLSLSKVARDTSQIRYQKAPYPTVTLNSVQGPFRNQAKAFG